MADNITRQNTTLETNGDPTNPVDHLDGGYEGQSADTDLIPSCTIEDCDKAIHRLFDKDIGFTNKQFVGPTKEFHIPKPFVIFATGERFAIAKRLRPPRDKNGKLMLPAISIRRTSIEQTNEDIVGRGMNQYTGTLTIKKKLDPSDRDYQNLINKNRFKHLAKTNPTRDSESNSRNTSTNTSFLESQKDNNHIWQIITIPQPQFYTATYEITFWTNYIQHMNYMIETLFASYLPQGRTHKLVTDKGYWFMAYTDEQKNSQDNFEDLKDSERLVRYSITTKVKGYILAPQGSTNSTPVRKHISSPQITFDVYQVNDEVQSKEYIENIQKNISGESKWELTDVNAIDDKQKQSDKTLDKFVTKESIIDPTTGKRKIKYVSLKENTNTHGETVYKVSNVKTLEEFIKTIK